MSPYLKLLRPHQWLKNTIVFAGLIFSHQWAQLTLLQDALLVFIAFSLMASTIYIFNDIRDQEKDRAHPIKRYRPIAARQITLHQALFIAALTGVISLTLGFLISTITGFILVIYLALSLAYTFLLKQWMVIDVIAIACGFLLRVLAGTFGIDIPPSHWLLLCTLFVALFLGFCKRYAENAAHYPPLLLRIFIAATAVGSILSYLSYTISIPNLLPSVLFVIFGIVRYLYLINRKRAQYFGLDMAYDLGRDKPLALSVLLWLLSVIILVQ